MRHVVRWIVEHVGRGRSGGRSARMRWVVLSGVSVDEHVSRCRMARVVCDVVVIVGRAVLVVAIVVVIVVGIIRGARNLMIIFQSWRDTIFLKIFLTVSVITVR